MNAKEFLEKIDEAAVLAAVREAERSTSGEVRVFVSRRRLRGRDVTKRAHKEFHRLDMDTTEDRNAVLFYVVPRERRFAVISAGSGDGVAIGMPVRAADGLLGRVIDTGATAARVLLVSDRANIVPSRLLRRYSDTASPCASRSTPST